MTDVTNKNGWVFYDGECNLCIALADRFCPLLHTHGFALAPLQGAQAAKYLGPVPPDVDEGMRVVAGNGAVLTGAEAVVFIARFVWWAWPVRGIARLPLGMKLLRGVYGWIAAHRNCATGTCAVPPKNRHRDWLPLVLLPVIALFATLRADAWVCMWALAFSIFAGCKWLTFSKAATGATLGRSIGYLLLWPGMDARTFLDPALRAERTFPREWIFAIFKMALGALLLWGVAHRISQDLWLLRGWAGMCGMIFLLHFGAFHLLALAWRAAGVRVEPIMRFPVAAKSLGEFWSTRWNRGFNDLARRYLFEPFHRHFGAVFATLFTFLASGLIHETVISLPARGGYGLPTLYFTIQGAGILVQRSHFGKRAGLRHGPAGRAFTLIVAAGPAFWLFHPPFVQRVIIPFMQTIGAL